MNKDEFDKMLEQLKLNIAAYKFKEEKQKVNTLKNKEGGGISYMKKKIIATACACLVLVSGIVAATAIKNSKSSDRGLGNGVDTAVENGYIANPEMDFVKFDDKGTEIKIENFVMDDVNLSTTFTINFGDNLTESIDVDKISTIEIRDLIVKDENNRIIYSSLNKEEFDKYCKENNLDYNFGEFNENYMNNGLNTYIVSKTENSITLMYNMYANNMPKSKKLYFSFENIEFTCGLEYNCELNGKWCTYVDVPEEMYNRNEEYYKVVSCTNKDFNVYTAKVTDTGFEIGVIISNLKRPEENDGKFQEFCTAVDQYNNEEISEEEYEDILEKWYYQWAEDLSPISVSNTNERGDTVEASYIENENGEKFKSTLSPSRQAINQFIDETHFCFYETFSMTKYNSNNKIKAVLFFHGSPVVIELEKNNGK